MFPTLDQEIDGFKDLWKREQVSQSNLTGKLLSIEITRGEIATDLRGWRVHGEMPEDRYRIWTLTAKWEEKSYKVDMIVPDVGGRYFQPEGPTEIATEGFFEHPGLLRTYVWDIEFQQENRVGWMPMRYWKLVNTDAQPGKDAWGMKL